MLIAAGLIERNVVANERIAFWAPVIAVALFLLVALAVVSIVSDLSTGQNERRDKVQERKKKQVTK